MAALLDLIEVKRGEGCRKGVESKRGRAFDEWSKIGFEDVEVGNN